MTSTHDCMSSCLALGCSLSPSGAIAASTSLEPDAQLAGLEVDELELPLDPEARALRGAEVDAHGLRAYGHGDRSPATAYQLPPPPPPAPPPTEPPPNPPPPPEDEGAVEAAEVDAMIDEPSHT